MQNTPVLTSLRKLSAMVVAFSMAVMSFSALPAAAADGDTAFPTIVIRVQGGTATPSSFAVRLTNQETGDVYDEPESETEEGPSFIVPAGTYDVEVSEDLVENYQISFPEVDENDQPINNGCDEDGVLAMESNGWDGACSVLATALEEPEPQDVGYMRVFVGVTNDNGGTLNAEDVVAHVDGETIMSGEALEVTPGSHVVTTDEVEGYAVRYSSDCDEEGNIDVDAWTEEEEFNPETDAADRCNIILDDIAPQLTVIKKVVHHFGEDPERNGGVPSDFTLHVENTFDNEGPETAEFDIEGNEEGETIELTAGTYDVQESPYTRVDGEDSEDEHGYTVSYTTEDNNGEGYDCSGEIHVGEHVTCIVTNEPPLLPTQTIRVKKNVINDNGGSSESYQFLIGVEMSLNGQTHTEYINGYELGITVQVPAGASYSVKESPYYAYLNEHEELEPGETLHHYTASYEGACAGQIPVLEDEEDAGLDEFIENTLFIQNAAFEDEEELLCTVTNNDPAPAPAPQGGGNGVPPPTPQNLPPHGFADGSQPSGNGSSDGGQVLGTQEDAPTTQETIDACRAEDPDTVLLTMDVNEMLVQLGLSRDESSEQKYDATLMPRILPANATSDDRTAARNFTTYGPNSIMYLGAGERAGVIASYVSVYGRMPQTECDWQNVLRIAKGQVPVVLSPSHELEVGKDFAKVYGREADRAQQADNVTLLIMSYGLRPRDRSLSAERQAIVIFRRIYGHNPSTTREWDVMRGIAYGGLQVPGSAAIVR